MISPIRVEQDSDGRQQATTLRLVPDEQAQVIAVADALRDVAVKLTLMNEVVLTQMVTLDTQKQQRAATLARALLLEAAEGVSHAEDAVTDLAKVKRSLGRL